MSAAAAPAVRQLDFEAVRRILPQSFPFLLLDRVTELEAGRLVALKNVTGNEPYFPGHFATQAVMPGVLIIEAAAQAVAILRWSITEEVRGYLAHSAMSFRQLVTPGDQLWIEASVKRWVGNLLVAKVTIRVSGNVVAHGELTVSGKGKEEAP